MVADVGPEFVVLDDGVGRGGIAAAEFCPLRYHLMLVRYDRDMYSSQDVLNRVQAHNIDARLIGPV